MCVCMHACMHVYTHTLNFPYVYTNVYIHAYTAYTHTHMYLHIDSKIMNGLEGSYGINVFWYESKVNKLPLSCIDLALRKQNGDKLIYRLSYIFMCAYICVYMYIQTHTKIQIYPSRK